MKPSPRAACAVIALTLVLALLAGCASAPAPTPTPTPVTVAAAPTATFMPTATTRPTSTPTAVPTATPSPTKAPDNSAALATLLKDVRAKQEQVKSARGLMEIKMEGRMDGKQESATMAVEFELNEPNMRMAMKMQGAELPTPMDIEFIIADKTAYMKMGGEWMAFPADQVEGVQEDMDFFNMDEMDEFLSDASNVRSLGRRTVKGVECEIIGFTLPQAKMLELAREQGRLDEDDELPEDMGFEDFKGEFAIGVSDKLMHEMVINMAFFDKTKPQERFKMDMRFTFWDVNSPGIVIKAPAGVQPFGQPASTPLPRS